MKRFIAAHRFENVPYLWREFLYFVFIDTTGVMSESNNVKKNGKESTVIYLFIYFLQFFFLSYTKEYRLHSLLHHSRFQTSSLLHMIEDEKSSGDPWITKDIFVCGTYIAPCNSNYFQRESSLKTLDKI